jgi:hypothetical protein
VRARSSADSAIKLALSGGGLNLDAGAFPAGASAAGAAAIEFAPSSATGHFLFFDGMRRGDSLDISSIELRRIGDSHVASVLRKVRFTFETPPELYNAYLGSSQSLAPVLRTFAEIGYRELFANQAGTQADGCSPYCITGQTHMPVQTIMMLQMTPLLEALRLWRPDVWRNQMTSYQKDPLDVVSKIPPGVPQPFVLWAHILSPHPPFIFNADCSIRDEFRYELDPRVTLLREDEEAIPLYLDQISCVNQRMAEAIERIVATDPGAIVVIQGDHGRGHLPASFEASEEDGILSRYAILNALRLPEPCQRHAYDDMSSVNTFRLVFACLAGSDPVFVPDRMFDGTKARAVEIRRVVE